MPPRFVRLCLSLGGLFLATLLVWGSAPLWLPLAVFVDLVRPRRFAVTRTGVFIATLLTRETLAALTGLALTPLVLVMDRERWLDLHYPLQRWWAGGLGRSLFQAFGMELEVDADPAGPGPALIFSRHQSTPDTLLPMVAFAHPAGWRARYVIKQELQWEPCLDLVANRVPNVFIDRQARRRGEHHLEIARIAELGATMREGDCVVMFPEGTRFEPAKKRRIIASLRERGDPERASWAEGLRHTLPPRPGGALALLDAASDADVYFLAHVGFEGTTRLHDFLNGSLVGRRLRVQVRRVAADEVPASAEERMAWLDAHWERIDAWIDAQPPSDAEPRARRA